MSKKAAPTSVAPKLSPAFTVPLSHLWLSDDANVRSKETVSSDGITQLASMLFSQGQINPLVVSKLPESDQYTVHAGGRRLRGFWSLRESGTITNDFQIHVREIDPAFAIDVSLVENLSQEPMHPADEFLAFQRLVDNGRSPEQIANDVGCKTLHVKRRLKLASVAPVLLQQFRAGDINLDQIMALASCDDQERQVMIWKGLPDWMRSDQQIRRRIGEDQISVDDPRVSIVGMDAYLAAGGSVHNDLFTENGDAQFLTDTGLLEMLLAEKVEAVAENTRSEGWAWVEVLPSFGYDERRSFPDYPVVHLPETPDQASRRESLQAEIDALEATNSCIYDQDEQSDADDALVEANESKMSGLQERIDAITSERIDRSGIDMLIAGAVVYVAHDQIVVKKPVVKAGDAKSVRAKVGHRGAAGSQDSSASNGADTSEKAPLEVISERLMMNLSAQRTAAIQALMVDDQKVSLAALASAMCVREFGKSFFADSPLKISLNYQWHTLRDASPTFEASPAHAVLIAKRDAWAALLPAEPCEYLVWFIEQPLEVSLSMITFCTAMSTNAVRGRLDSADCASQLAGALKLDMTKWWAPTPENYLSLVPKAKMLEAVAQANGDGAGQGLDKMKKAEAIAYAAAALEGSGWLPSPLRN